MISIPYYWAGVSAATGRPFAPPSDFRVVPRPNAGRKERSEVLHGKCQRCKKWVPVEGIKDVESKVSACFTRFGSGVNGQSVTGKGACLVRSSAFYMDIVG